MNASAFLGRQVRVRNPSTPYRRGKIVDSSANYSNRIERRVQRTPTTKSLLTIRRKVFDVENTLKALLNLNEKSLVMKKRIKLVQGQEERDSKKSSRMSSNLGGLIQRPKTGAMDFISNFLTFTFLGWLFTVLQPLFGKLEGLIPLFNGALGFFSGVLTGLFNGFASFVKFGYDTHDKIKGAETEVKKQASNIKKTFDDSTSALSEMLNSTTKIATSFLNIFGGKYDTPPSNTSNTTQENIVSFSSLASSATPAIARYAEGGSINSGRIDPRTPISRGVDQRRKPEQKQKPIPQQLTTQPGKDVGGADKIRELYSQKSSNFNIFSIFDRTHKSGYAALTKTSEEFKKTNSTDFLGIGNLMSISVDASLGQKPEKRAYTQFAEGINYLVSFGLTQSEEFKKLNIEKMIESIVESKVDSALNKVREEINKKSMVEEAGDPGGGDEPGGIAGGEYGAYAPTGMEKQIYDYLINVKKMNDFQALGLMANISRESSFIPSNKEPGGTGVGLFQWSHGRVAPFMRAVPDWKTNWKAQIDYALSEPENLSLVKPGAYQSKQFKSAQEAADWWMNQWERPRDPSSGSKKHSTYLNAVPRGPNGSAKFREGSTPENLSVQGGILPSTRFISSYRGWRWGRMHRGVDYAGDGVNDKPVSIIKSGKVVTAGYDPGGGGYIVVIQHNDGTMSKYFHLKEGSIKVRDGENISPGRVIGIVGNTGRSTGTHLHFEVWKGNKDLDKPHLLADNYFRFGGNVKPTQVKPVEVKPKPKPTPGEPPIPENQTPKGEAYMINGKMYYVDTKGQGRVTAESGAEIDFSGGKNRALLKEISKLRELRRGSATPKKKYGGLVYSKGSDPLLPPDKYASYNDPSMTSTILIQPIIKSNIVPINMESNSPIMFSKPSVNSSSNNFELMRS
jgi:murein DD-endopeptidase MepM/ murein hydrolase activator NlpD